MTMPNHINSPLSDYTTKILSMYLKFPENQPFTAVDFRARNGHFLSKLTEKHEGEKYLFGVEENKFLAEQAREFFHKVCCSSYKAEAKMSKEVFSLAIIDPFINYTLYNEVFDSIDPFVEPDFEKEERERLMMSEKWKDQIDFGNEGLSEEEIENRKEDFEEKLKKAVKERRLAYRRALRAQEKRYSTLRDDSFLLARATERLMPGGILIMITPKELIDQAITIRLANQYEDIRILRLEDDEYQSYRKCIILAKKKTRKEQNREKGLLLAETKLTPYQELEVISPQVEPLYEIPAQSVEAVKSFRVGPLSAEEVAAMARKSSLLDTYKKTYSQVLTNDDPVSPTPLHKGHIMLLLTSGFLNGYIGTGPDQHLVKGSVIKLSRDVVEHDEEGVETTKEREYYHISVKYLDREGKFHTLM